MSTLLQLMYQAELTKDDTILELSNTISNIWHSKLQVMNFENEDFLRLMYDNTDSAYLQDIVVDIINKVAKLCFTDNILPTDTKVTELIVLCKKQIAAKLATSDKFLKDTCDSDEAFGKLIVELQTHISNHMENNDG